MERKIERNG